MTDPLPFVFLCTGDSSRPSLRQRSSSSTSQPKSPPPTAPKPRRVSRPHSQGSQQVLLDLQIIWWTQSEPSILSFAEERLSSFRGYFGVCPLFGGFPLSECPLSEVSLGPLMFIVPLGCICILSHVWVWFKPHGRTCECGLSRIVAYLPTLKQYSPGYGSQFPWILGGIPG